MMCLKHIFHRTFTAVSMVILLSACDTKPVATAASPEEIKQRISDSTAPLLLVHAWATWCHPCREEFPELMRICRQYSTAELEVMLISADDPGESQVIETFLAEYDSPVGSWVTTELDQGFIEALSPGWAGSLPATFFYSDGRLLDEWEGKRSYEHYAETIDRLLRTIEGGNP